MHVSEEGLGRLTAQLEEIGGHTGKFLPWKLLYKVLSKQKKDGRGPRAAILREGGSTGEERRWRRKTIKGDVVRHDLFWAFLPS